MRLGSKTSSFSVIKRFQTIFTFPNEISGCPSSAASKLTKSSGAEVAKETTVIPTTKVEILSLSAKETEPFTKNSPPTVNKNKPKMR